MNGGGSLVATQDCIFGGKYHGGALALRGRFRPKIDFSRRRDPGTNPTYGRPFLSWVPDSFLSPTIPTEEHHPREGFRGRFETHEKDRRRLSSLLLLEFQRHTRVLHDETVSEEELVTGAL